MVNRRKNGQRYFEEKTITPLTDDHGIITHFVSSGKDVTRQKATEAALHQNEARYKTILETSSEGFWLIDHSHLTVDVNSSLCTMLGYTKQEMLGKLPTQFTDETNREIFQRKIAREDGNDMQIFEIDLLRKDGTPLSALFHAARLRDEQGAVSGSFAFVTDISRLKRLQQQLKNVNDQLKEQVQEEIRLRMKGLALFEAIYRDSALGIVLADDEGRMAEINPAFARMLGYTPKELQGKTFKEITYPDDTDTNLTLFGELLHHERRSYRMEKRYITKNGTVVWGNLYVSLLSVTDRPAPYVLAMVEDITAAKEGALRQKEQEQLLITQSRMAAMGEMIGAIAHQWRQPLNALAIMLQNMEDAYDFGEMDQQLMSASVEDAMEQIHYMSRTIDDFRNFFKPAKEKEAFNLIDVTDKIVGMLSPQFKASALTFSRHLDREHHPRFEYVGYPNEFKQVLLNLFNNAKDAILQRNDPRLRNVDIRFETNGSNVRIEITDTGGGIPEDALPRIFDPYFSTKGDKGTGVGLFMS